MSLRAFATGAVIQHFTKTLDRIAGVDFRLPTDEELDALEAFSAVAGATGRLAAPAPAHGDGGGEIMRRLSSAAVLLTVSVAAPGPARPQQATEQFIPIGQSPGASGTLSWIGDIAATDARAKNLTITDGNTPRTAKITDKTRIFLDRSKVKQTNLTGTFADLQKGRRVEVKYARTGTTPAADWVKVEISQP